MPRTKWAPQASALVLTVLFANQSIAESICNPFSVHTCALPFPSNHFSIADPGSPTGMKLQITDELLPEYIYADVSEATKPSTVLNGLTGFSALSAVSFELVDAIDSNTLPQSGGEAVKVFDKETGELVPIQAGTSMPAMAASLAEPSQIVEVYPRSRWQWQHTYIAVMTKALKNIDGINFAAAEGVTTAVNNPNSELGQKYADDIAFLASQGIAGDEILSFTSFTVRDEASVTTTFLEMVDTVRAQEHPVKISKISYSPVGNIAAHIDGQVLLSDFREEDDGRIDYQSGDQGKEYWTQFYLTLPTAALDGPVPIVIYGHGITVDKTTGAAVELQNAANGIATISIDQPNHGSRIDRDGYLLKHFNTEGILKITSMVTQSSLDFHALLVAVQKSLGELDILPGGSDLFSNSLHSSGVGTPDIDTSKIFYIGTSLGGLFGTAFAATAPDLKGVFLQVAGAGVGNTLLHTGFYEVLGMDNMIPKEATGAEAVFMLNAVLHQIDMGDGLNYAHYFRNPPEYTGLKSRPLTVQYGIGDQIVYNGASIALAEAAELPLVSPASVPLDFLLQAENIGDGYALYQSPKTTSIEMDNNPNALSDVWSHLTFIDNTTINALEEWFAAVVFKEENNTVDDEDSFIKPAPLDSCAFDVTKCTTTPPPQTSEEPTPTPIVIVKPTASVPSSPTSSTPGNSISPPTSSNPVISSSSSGGSLTYWGNLLLLVLMFSRRFTGKIFNMNKMNRCIYTLLTKSTCRD